MRNRWAERWVSTLFRDYAFTGAFIAIKNDIEGYELHALRGMRRLLRDTDILLQIEIFDSNRSQVDRFLKDSGFEELHRIGHDYFYAKGRANAASAESRSPD